MVTRNYSEEDIEELIELCDKLILENEELRISNEKLQNDLSLREEMITDSLYFLDKITNNLNRI